MEVWVKDGCGDLYERVHDERKKREQPKQTTPTITTSTTKDHSNTTAQVDEAIEREGMSKDKAREIGKSLTNIGESEARDSQQLAKRSVPTWLIVIILAVGLPLFLRWLGVL
jgi:hypothetical protein